MTGGVLKLLEKSLLFQLHVLGICVVGERVDADTASRHKPPGDLQILGIHQFDEILHDDVHAVLVKVPMITEGEEIEFETLALHHPLAGDITDIDMSEIRLAGLGAQGSELRTVERHQIFVLRMFVRKGLQYVRVIIVAVLNMLVTQQRHAF